MATTVAKSASVRNCNRVPVSQWRKWSGEARRVFNEVYDVMVANAEMFLNPKQGAPKRAEWRTTSWNAAWIAAECVDARLT